MDGCRQRIDQYDPVTDRHRILKDIYQMVDVSDSAIVTQDKLDSLYPLSAFDCSDVDVGAHKSKRNVQLEVHWNQTDAAASIYRVLAVIVSERQGEIDTDSGSTVITLHSAKGRIRQRNLLLGLTTVDSFILFHFSMTKFCFINEFYRLSTYRNTNRRIRPWA